MPTPGITELGDRCDDRANGPIKHPPGKQHTHGYQTRAVILSNIGSSTPDAAFSVGSVFRTSGHVDEDLLVGRMASVGRPLEPTRTGGRVGVTVR
jgi:hypothetical protein